MNTYIAEMSKLVRCMSPWLVMRTSHEQALVKKRA